MVADALAEAFDGTAALGRKGAIGANEDSAGACGIRAVAGAAYNGIWASPVSICGNHSFFSWSTLHRSGHTHLSGTLCYPALSVEPSISCAYLWTSQSLLLALLDLRRSPVSLR
jgi:hypothetical protein